MTDHSQKIAEYKKRYQILAGVDDEEIRRIALRESSTTLPKDEKYIDLDHLEKGIQTAGGKEPISLKTGIPESSVSKQTWKKLTDALSKKMTNSGS